MPRNREIEARILGSASRPIFWPFVGIGGRNHGVLEKLDHLSGRIVDNCIFFALDDRHGVSEGELYDHPLNEFPSWLNEARRKGLLARGPTRLFLHPLATH
ncbi:VWA domain-containing protein [Thiocystis violacea]|uniref:VWA domain-containing protein n=1 Tax=Thiocystis violacea TaxID=13725 RepID=UPI00190797AA